MANPQKENGHIDIANDIADKLCSFRLNGQEWQIVWVILRKTWGWLSDPTDKNSPKKKMDRIALSQFTKLTGINRSRCHTLLKGLVDKKIISKTVTKKCNTYSISYGFQKDYDKWELLPKSETVTKKCNKVLPKSATEVLPKSATEVLPKSATTKETITKETITKETITKDKEKRPTYPIPEWIEKETWDDFCEMRKNKKEPLTDITAKRIIAKLDRLRPTNDPNEVLDESIQNGWKGVFPLKNNKQKDPNVANGQYSDITAKNIEGFKNWKPPC